MGELGVTFKDDGRLEFDETRFNSRYAQDPEAVKAFFTTAESGFSAKFKQLGDRLSDPYNSLLTSRIDTLVDKIESNEARIQSMDARLAVQTERLYMQFYNMELAIGKLQNNLSVLDAIQPMEPYWRGSNT